MECVPDQIEGWNPLPAALHLLANWWIISASAVMFAIEFFADKLKTRNGARRRGVELRGYIWPAIGLDPAEHLSLG
jgi:hypothetical protein